MIDEPLCHTNLHKNRRRHVLNKSVNFHLCFWNILLQIAKETPKIEFIFKSELYLMAISLYTIRTLSILLSFLTFILQKIEFESDKNLIVSREQHRLIFRKSERISMVIPVKKSFFNETTSNDKYLSILWRRKEEKLVLGVLYLHKLTICTI